MAGGRPCRFPHNNFSSVYWIFTKLGHMIPCGRGQRSRSPLLSIEFLTTGSFLHDNFSSVYWNFTKLGHMIPLWKGKKPIYFGVITIIPFDNLYDGRILWCTHFLFSYIMMGWIFIVLVHWNNNLLVDIPIHSDSFSRLWVNQSLLLLLNSVCLEE